MPKTLESCAQSAGHPFVESESGGENKPSPLFCPSED
jgi:hypothetical protein